MKIQVSTPVYVQIRSSIILSNYIQRALTLHIAVVTGSTIGKTFILRAKWLRFIRQAIGSDILRDCDYLKRGSLRASFVPLVQQIEFLKLSHDSFLPTRSKIIKFEPFDAVYLAPTTRVLKRITNCLNTRRSRTLNFIITTSPHLHWVSRLNRIQHK